MPSVQIARYIIAFTWLYHGIFPKLIQIAPLEKLMTSSLGFTEEITYLMIKSAGIGEAIFGIVLFMYYQSKIIIWLNMVGLVSLLLAVVILQPQLLIEAFNPVTTNISLIGLSLILLNSLNKSHSA